MDLEWEGMRRDQLGLCFPHWNNPHPGSQLQSGQRSFVKPPGDSGLSQGRDPLAWGFPWEQGANQQELHVAGDQEGHVVLLSL